MALKILLKPNEKMIIGGAVIQNGPHKSEFSVENNVPILRQRDIISPDDAHSPARRIYLAVQLMYVDDPHKQTYLDSYWQLVREFVAAAPRSVDLVDSINEQIYAGNFYQALKLVQQLITFEQEVIERVAECS